MKSFLSATLFLFVSVCSFAAYIPLGSIVDTGNVSANSYSYVTSVELYWLDSAYSTEKLTWGQVTQFDIGKTLYVNANSNYFSTYVQLLTNKVDTLLYIKAGARPGYLETGAVIHDASATKYFQSQWPDFYGCQIYNIAMRLDKLIINWRDDPQPNGQLGWVSISYGVTYTINAIPEPMSATLFGLGSVLLGRKR